MKRSIPRLAPLGALLVCSVMVGAQTTPPRTPAQQTITPNFPANTDLQVIADAVGQLNGIDFIIDQRARTQMGMGGPNARAMTPRQFYDEFLATLQVYSLAAIRVDDSGRVMKIVPEQIARQLPAMDLATPQNSFSADDMVSVLVEVKNLNPVQITQVLKQYQGAGDNFTQVTGTQKIYLQGRASTVRRIQRLLASVDESSNTDFQMIPLKNAVAKDVAAALTAAVQGQPADAAAGLLPAKIVADDRTNSLFVVGNPAQRLMIASMADSYDSPFDNGGGTQVISLKYATADDLATTLKAQISGVSATTGATAGAAGGAGAATANSAAAIADRSVVIQPHAATNKLIVTAPARTMAQIKILIQALDIPPDQVHIEAIVAKITDSKAADLGVNWAVFSNEANTNVPIGGFVQPVSGSSIVDLAGAVNDVESAVSNNKIPLGATFAVGMLRDAGTNLAAMFRAVRTDGNSNIVSLPNVTTQNNQEAEMKSVQKVPFLTNQVTNTGAGLGGNNGLALTNQVQRQDVGTTLKVTPQIIADTDEVILKIELTNSELTGKAGDAGSLISEERSVKTQVRVHTGATIVIGGMIKNDNDDNESRVPLLSKIPLIGELFRTHSSKREKSNMMIFIQPRILRDAVQANAETAARFNALREVENALNLRKSKELVPALPKDNTSTLPDLPVPPPVPARAPAVTTKP